mmetsp:Transcript_100035/g.182525  ORF Transcript_100035/g.182525 Transcript_100035/m.182525 type:complete len:379 (+) Transcript_100035:65-1201(+)
MSVTMRVIALLLAHWIGKSLGHKLEERSQQTQDAKADQVRALERRQAFMKLLLASTTPATGWQVYANSQPLVGLKRSAIHTKLRTLAAVDLRMSATAAANAASAAATTVPPVPMPPHTKIKGEILTPYGLILGISVYFTACMVQIPVMLAYLWSQLFDKKRRRAVDWIIFFWAKFSMTVCGYVPEVVGLENLPKSGTNCLYVPNHTSFLDILTLTGFLPRAMKYVSKAEILKIPFIGWPMKLAGHIALKTSSRRSQLETFKDTVQSLKDGNSVITFPEGTRSKDGRLQPFKRGPFKMAIQAGVPIVPVTICGLARWYPKGTLLPIDVPKGVRVIVHPQVSTEGADEATLCKQVYEILNDSLPPYQQAPAGQDSTQGKS